MATCSAIIDEERDNFFRLSLLLFRVGNQKLRKFFKSQWPIVYQNKTGIPPPVVQWNDTPNDATEMNKIETKLKFQFKDQKKSFDSGNTNNWDFSILTTVLINSSLDFVTAASPESNAIKDMKEIRNNFIGHAPDARIPTAVFNTEWPKACQALKYFNATQEEFDDVLKDVEKPIECILPILKELNFRLDRHESNILNVVYQLQEEMEKQNKEILTAIRSLCAPAAISPVSVTAVLAIQPERECNEPVARCPKNDTGNETESNVEHENCYYNDDCRSSDDDDVSCAFRLCCWFVEFKNRNREKGIKKSSRTGHGYMAMETTIHNDYEEPVATYEPVASPISIDEEVSDKQHKEMKPKLHSSSWGASPVPVRPARSARKMTKSRKYKLRMDEVHRKLGEFESTLQASSRATVSDTRVQDQSQDLVLIGKSLEKEEYIYDDTTTGEEPVVPKNIDEVGLPKPSVLIEMSLEKEEDIYKGMTKGLPKPSVLIEMSLEKEEDIYKGMTKGEEPVVPKSIDEGPSPSSEIRNAFEDFFEAEGDIYDDMNTGEEPVVPKSIDEVTLYELCRNDPTVFQDLGRELDPHDKDTVARNPSELETTASPTRILLEWLLMTQRNLMVSKLLEVFSQQGLNDAYGVLQEKLSRYYNKLGQHK